MWLLDHVAPHQDPQFSAWRLAWIAHQLPRAPFELLDANILHPARAAAAFSDATPLLGILAAPLVWIGIPTVVVYNVLLLAAFVSASLGAFLLVRDLTKSNAAAIVAGIVFGFSPFRFEHYMHLEIVWSAWIPLSLWALHRAIATDRWAFGIATGLFVAAQVFSCIYLAIFQAVWLVVIGVLLIAFGLLDVRKRAFRALVLGAAIGGLLCAPYLRAYTNSSRIVGTRSVEETAGYSAKPENYLASTDANWWYGWTRAEYGENEKSLSPGVIAVVLALVGLWPPITRPRLIYAIATLFAFDLSLGYNGLFFPTLREVVPLFAGLRVMARAATLVHLGLAVLAGYGVARMMAMRSPAVSVFTLGPTIAAVATVLLIVEYTNKPLMLMPLPTRPSMLQTWLAHKERLVLLELPMPRIDRLPGQDPRYEYDSTFHWQRMVNGYSAFVPPRYARLLEIMFWFPDARSIGVLRGRGVTHVIVHQQLYPTSAEARALVEKLAQSPDFAFVDFFEDGFGQAAVFRLLGTSAAGAHLR
jgi:hypothetical protein